MSLPIVHNELTFINLNNVVRWKIDKAYPSIIDIYLLDNSASFPLYFKTPNAATNALIAIEHAILNNHIMVEV